MFGVCTYRKKLFTSVNFFIHLNLSISLLLALTVFVSGIETATINQVIMNLHVTAWNNDSVFFNNIPIYQILCTVVAALLHYFFLCVFCWMLCEGIMLYLLLVVVFSKMAKQWWLFFIIGYCMIKIINHDVY